MKLIIHTNTLRALLCFAGKQERRFYLNGVHLEVTAGSAIAVATQGVILGAAKLPMPPDGHASIIVPREAIELALKGLPRRVDVLEFEFADGERDSRCLRDVTVGNVKCKELDGKFPEWRRVMPREVSGELAQYDPDFLATIKKASGLARGRHSVINKPIGHNGTSAGVVEVAENFIGIIQPFNWQEVEVPTGCPDWATECPQVAEVAT